MIVNWFENIIISKIIILYLSVFFYCKRNENTFYTVYLYIDYTFIINTNCTALPVPSFDVLTHTRNCL